MSFRTTAILFGIVFLLGVGLLILSFSEDDTTPSKELLLSTLAGAKAEEVDTVEIEKGAARLVLKRKDKNWEIVEPVAAKAEAGSVDRLIESLLKVRPTTYPELNSNPAVHGLETPGLRVTLRSGDKSDTLNIGDVTIGGSKAVGFVTTSQRKRPMAVSRADLDPLFKESKAGSAGDLAKWTNDYRVKQVFALSGPAGADDATAVKLAHGKKELAINKTGAVWQFTNPAGWGDAALAGELNAANPSAVTGVRSLINTIVNLQAGTADDFIDHVTDEAKLKEYGLNSDNPDLIRVELKDKNGDIEKAILAKKAEAPPAPPVPGGPLPPASPAKLYVKLEGSQTVVRVTPPATWDGFVAAIANPDPLRDRDLVKDSDKNGIDAIDLVVGGQTTKLRKAGGQFGKWQLFGGPNDPQDANPDAIRKLLDLVAKPGVVKDFPPSTDANFTPAETRAEVKLWVNGIEPNTDPKADAKAEPKLKGGPIVLQFGKKDAEGIFVRRTQASGAKNDCRLPDKVKVAAAAAPASPFGDAPSSSDAVLDVVATVAKTRLDFLDTSLKSFSQFQAAKLTIQNGANVVEVVKEKSADMLAEPKWKYVQPPASKDRTADTEAVTSIVQVLATTSVVKFIAETPAEADLARWGLDPKSPRIKVTVGLDTGPAPPPMGEKKDKPDSERIWYFGNETEDKLYVYARQDGKSAVFTVLKVVADRFVNPDLRDKTIVRFDRTKVKKVSLKGWKDKSGFEVELVFEKNKDGAWAVTKPPGAYMLDPAKLDKFIDSVNNLRARAFIPGGPKPEQKLPTTEGGLQATLDIEGAPSVLLFIGGTTDADSSTFVQTSTLPPNENIVTVVAEVFKAFKDNSGSFAK